MPPRPDSRSSSSNALGLGRDEVPARRADRRRVLDVDEPRGDVDERLVGAVPVDHEDAVEAVMAERAAEVEQVLDEDVPAQRDGAREVQVVRRVAVHRGREQQRGAAVGVDALARAARDLLDQAHVGVDRQVMAVILERRRRDHDDDVVAGGELGQLRPGVLLVAEVRHARNARSAGGWRSGHQVLRGGNLLERSAFGQSPEPRRYLARISGYVNPFNRRRLNAAPAGRHGGRSTWPDARSSSP